MFAKNLGFTIVAVVSLALGIGANCAMLSAADSLLLRPLPVPNADEVVSVGARNYDGANNSLQCSYLDYLDVRERAHSFSGLVAFSPLRAAIARDRDSSAQVKAGAVISADFFSVLGVKIELDADSTRIRVPGRDPVVILSHDLWTEWFDGSADVAGRKVRIGGIDFTIVGVAPEAVCKASIFAKQYSTFHYRDVARADPASCGESRQNTAPALVIPTRQIESQSYYRAGARRDRIHRPRLNCAAPGIESASDVFRPHGDGRKDRSGSARHRIDWTTHVSCDRGAVRRLRQRGGIAGQPRSGARERDRAASCDRRGTRPLDSPVAH